MGKNSAWVWKFPQYIEEQSQGHTRISLQHFLMHTPLVLNDPCREAVHSHCAQSTFSDRLHTPFIHWYLIYLIIKNAIKSWNTARQQYKKPWAFPHTFQCFRTLTMHYFYFPNTSKQSATGQICPVLNRPTRRTTWIYLRIPQKGLPYCKHLKKTKQKNPFIV